MGEWIDDTIEIITYYRGTYRGIHWSIIKEDNHPYIKFKWAGGLRGSGESDSYSDSVDNIKRVINKSLKLENENGK